MKTSAELAASPLDSAAAHKQRSASLRRLAGGLKSEALRAEATGLSEMELGALRAAEVVLEALASAYTGASKHAQQRSDDRDRAERAVREAMADNFSCLKTIPERVALIAAVKSYILRDGTRVETVRDLDYWFRDAINELVYRLAGQAKDRAASSVVQEAWEKFSGARNELEAQFVALIGQLVVAGGRDTAGASA